MVNARIQFEKISGKTFPDLKELVIEQATHHEAKYVGDDDKFVAALGRKDPVPQILMVRNDDTQEPLGYILFNHYHGFKGQELYIEDILVSSRERSHGFGLAMTEELKAYGRQLGIAQISWTVAENNPNAIRFYEKKMQAHELQHGVYDCGHLFAAPPDATGASARRVDAADLDLLDTYVGILPGLTAEKMTNIRAAYAAENAEVYIATASDGTPLALGITNSNYSSFRTVYGYKLEVMELITDTAQAVKAFNAITSAVVDAGKTDSHTGHLNIYIDNKSQSQVDFIRATGASRLQMTDDPASVFALYGIGRDIIYPPAAPGAAKPKPAAPKPPQ